MGMLDRVSHTCSRREMNDDVRCEVAYEIVECITLQHIEPRKARAGGFNDRDVLLLQNRRIIGIKIVDSADNVTPGAEPLCEVGANESSRAGHKDSRCRAMHRLTVAGDAMTEATSKPHPCWRLLVELSPSQLTGMVEQPADRSKRTRDQLV